MYSEVICMHSLFSPIQVRDSGESDMHLLEMKVNDMVKHMNEQALMIEQLNRDLKREKQVLEFIHLPFSLQFI